MASFPTIEKVYSFFCPSRWEYALKHTDECLTYPCITLAQVDSVYNTIGATANIVRGQFVGIYSLSTAREQYNAQASNLAADLFVAKYQHECTLYDMMLYFANYLLEYKGSFAQYDIQDLISQFSKKYLPWKRLRLHPETEEPTKPTDGVSLAEMVKIWVRDGRTDDDFKEGGLYKCGRITDKMIVEARSEFESQQAAGVF